jgi:hypothetical protein
MNVVVRPSQVLNPLERGSYLIYRLRPSLSLILHFTSQGLFVFRMFIEIRSVCFF